MGKRVQFKNLEVNKLIKQVNPNYYTLELVRV